MPPPGYEPFLRAICADPEDDTARLVYADWLDENGDPDRAEFIRVQIEQVRGGDWATRSNGQIPQRLFGLWQRNHAAWQWELPQIRGVSWSGWDRGFLHAVGVNSGRAPFFDRADTLFAATPIQTISARNLDDAFIEQLVNLPQLDQIFKLDFVSCRFGSFSWRLISACRRLTGLRQLVIRVTDSLPGHEAVRAASGRVLLTELDASVLAEAAGLVNLDTVIVHGFLDPAVVTILLRRFKTIKHGFR